MHNVELLKRLLDRATRIAKSHGLDMDFARNFCLVHNVCNIGWYLTIVETGLFRILSTETLTTNYGHISLGMNFVRQVPFFERGYKRENILDKNAELQIFDIDQASNADTIYLPILDAFSRGFISEKAIEDILLALARHGARTVVAIYDYGARAEHRKKLEEYEKSCTEKIDYLKKLAKSPRNTQQDPTWRAEVQKALNAIQQIKAPSYEDPRIGIDLVGKPCSSLEELAIWLDING